MSNPDHFFDEVNEEVRRERLKGAALRYGWVAALAVLLVVGGAGVWEWRKHQARESAEAFGDEMIAALQAEDATARHGTLEAIAARETGGRRALAAMLAADAATAAGEPASAANTLAAVAGDSSLAPAWRELARLRQVIAAGDTMPEADRRAALDELSRPGAPYRALALEQVALLEIASGDRETAMTTLRALLQEPDVTPGLRRRASQLIVALGGTLDAG
ncbi:MULTISPECIES: tetratricopeptide repeat protein [Haematobacter]|uniref:Uncharacterized protein n=1 Tax=Haematobacter genomosp. 1 TaxID=366618 RepID=A0A212AG06_9RHOB|nr:MULTISPECIES: tetratricopeptide repeat protein [Haematobacter]OWJ80404.1 hypothetical protein CDV49_01000 [Haematobacter genomosp. 1]